MKMLSFIHKYPIISFFILTVMLGTSIIFLIFQAVIPAELALSSVLSVSISGIVLTALLEGKAGLKLLFRRVLIWRVGIGYWIFAVFFLVPVILLGSLINPFFNGNPVSLSQLKLQLSIVPMYIIFFIVAGLGQELGWTGFLLPRLQTRFSALLSSLIRATFVIAWHIPLLIFTHAQPDVIQYFPYGAWILQKRFWITFLAMTLLSLPWSILFTWLFNNTKGSLLLVAVFHGSEIWLVYLISGMGIDPKNLDNLWGYGIVMILSIVTIIIVTGPENLSRRYKRIAYPELKWASIAAQHSVLRNRHLPKDPWDWSWQAEPWKIRPSLKKLTFCTQQLNIKCVIHRHRFNVNLWNDWYWSTYEAWLDTASRRDKGCWICM